MIFFNRAMFEVVSVRMRVFVGPYDSRLLSFDARGVSKAPHLVHVRKLQGDELRHEGIAARRRQGVVFVRDGGNGVVLDVGGGNDLDDRPLRHHGEALDILERQEDLVRFVDAHRFGGNERYLPAHVAVQEKVLARQVAHQADDVHKFHVTEI